MKKRFNYGMKDAVCGESEDRLSVKEKISNSKAEIKRLEVRLKEHKLHMDSLRDMSQDYRHNTDCITNMVGTCYMNIDSVIGEIENVNATIKRLKSEEK